MINVKKVDIKKTEDLKTAHDLYINSHNYCLLYQSHDKLAELVEPQFIYNHDTCVGMLQQVLEEQPYYQLIMKSDIATKWTADILMDISLYLYHENGIQITGILTGKFQGKDKRYNKKVYKYYNRQTKQAEKYFDRLQTVRYLNEMKTKMNHAKETYDLNIELQSEKEKRRVK